MCDQHRPVSAEPRLGACLEHGTAHAEDHRRWSRREFMAGLGVAGASFMLGGLPLRAYGQTPLLHQLRALETDRVLVIVQLNGGNDGLNTVVPFRSDRYYQLRPNIALAQNSLLSLGSNADVGLHPSLAAVRTLYDEGQAAILQSVGYPAPNQSHFRSTDIWVTASDSNVVENTGWVGRHLDATHPDYQTQPSDFPLAVQIGLSAPLLFQGPEGGMGMSITSVDLYERLAATGTAYDVEGLPATAFGDEMRFVRSVANDAFRYAGAIYEASQNGRNTVDYPAGNRLATNLAVVAQLIKGRLGARIYHVSLGGFDTHANQLTAHANLLRFLAEGVKAFLDDLGTQRDDVLVMTFSEFGRRVYENGSAGTDHGTAAPLFLFGGDVEGGLYGPVPDLENLTSGNLRHGIDFRQAYATVLQDWFGLDAASVEGVLGGSFETLGFVATPATSTATEPQGLPRVFTLHQNYPNPFNPSTSISFALTEAAPVRLRVYDVAGREVALLLDGGVHAPGYHTVSFDASHLPSGTYLYRLETPAGQQSRKMVLVR